MATPTGQARAGKGGRVKVEGTNINASEKWSINESAAKVEANTFENGGYTQGTIGLFTAAADVDGWWDNGKNPHTDPPGIYPRDELGTTSGGGGVQFYENVSDNTFWSFPQMLVLSAKNSSDVKGRVDFSWSGENNGTYTRS